MRILRSVLPFASIALLVGCSAAAGDGDNTAEADESDLTTRPQTPSAANLYGFTDGAKVAQQGSGTITQNIGPSYKCKPKTTPPIPCGGWVSVTNDAGKTRVTFGALGHYEFYSYVSGLSAGKTSYVFPPLASNKQFWAEGGSVELDAAGHGHLDRKNVSAQGFLQSTASYDVTAADGAISVSFTSTLNPNSCNRYEQTCNFHVLAH